MEQKPNSGCKMDLFHLLKKLDHLNKINVLILYYPFIVLCCRLILSWVELFIVTTKENIILDCFRIGWFDIHDLAPDRSKSDWQPFKEYLKIYCFFAHNESWVATVVFNVCLMHAVAFSKQLRCLEPTRVITVKPVYNDHPRDPKILVVVDKGSLFRSHLWSKNSIWDLKMVVVVDRWSLLGGGRKIRFDCTLKTQTHAAHNGLKSQITCINCKLSWIIILIFSNLGNGNVTKMWIKW